MKKLPLPTDDHATVFATCLKGVGAPALVARYAHDYADCAAIELDYAQRARASTLYALPRINPPRGTDPTVLNTLTRSDLTKLYTDYLVPASKPARGNYDRLKVTPNGKCPLCGDIGQVRTLDHYLPKANFPLYSIVPANLIPCCRDCNSEKLNAFATIADRQTLHPYFDDNRFFTHRWLSARVIPGTPPIVEYSVTPPATWSLPDKSRVAAHFEEYDLAKRFSIEAGADLPETIQTRRTTSAALSPAEFSNQLREKSDGLLLPINHWRRVMFAALADDAWFCGHAHPNPSFP